MAEWEEIKRLAADFQRTQVTDTLQRLSDRNCIDIVKKLCDLNLIEIIHTCDGKEFITPDYLVKEIEDEVHVNNGRMQIHDLASKLNVDFQHIENKAKDLSSEYTLILGQIIHTSYKNILAKQIADHMLINGQLSVSEFTKNLDLPTEFLLKMIKEILPKDCVNQDERTFYTADFMAKYKSIISGTLTAIAKPTTISSLQKRLDIPERIFTPIVENLIKEGRLDATIENKLYIPSVFARHQNERINSFYTSNLYISYDVLSRMDIKQPKLFLKKRFPEGLQLKTCFISPNLLSQVESIIEETILSDSFIDITSVVPTAFEVDDINMLIQEFYKNNKKFKSLSVIFNETNICSLNFISKCKNSFKTLMENKAQEQLKQGILLDHFLGSAAKNTKSDKSDIKEDVDSSKDLKKINVVDEQNENIDEERVRKAKGGNRKSGGGNSSKQLMDDENFDQSDDDGRGKKSKGSRKSGGGTQGREIKQKSVKKKYVPSNKSRAARRGNSPDRSESDLIVSKHHQQQQQQQQKEPLIFMETDEITKKLKQDSRGFDECTDEFFESIAMSIEKELNTEYGVLAKQVLDEFLKKQEEEQEEVGEERDKDNTKNFENDEIIDLVD